MFIIYMMISIAMFLNSAPHGIIFLLIEEMKHTPNQAQDASLQHMVSGEALMIKKNDIDAFVDLSFPNISEIEKPIENICTLENAVNIMSNTLTKGVKFELQTIEFVYMGKL